jgi:hypothetical protein
MLRLGVDEMKRTRWFGMLTALAISIILTVSTAAQQPQKIYKKNSGNVTRQFHSAQASANSRTYVPRIKSRSSSFIIEGLITALDNNVIVIKTERGERHSFGLDDQTSVLTSDELVSIATMADISLSASDLRVSDRVEIVTERLGRREVARIITRIASSGAQVAKR